MTGAGHADFALSTRGSFTVTTAGFPAPNLTVSGALPTGLHFTDKGNAHRNAVGDPGRARPALSPERRRH